MKRNLLTTIVLAVLTIGMSASCNKDTNGTESSGAYNVVGTWEVNKITFGDSTGPKETEIIPSEYHAYFIFNADGSVYEKQTHGSEEHTSPKATWSLSGDVITVNDGELSYMKILKCTDVELILHQTFPNDDEFQEYEMTRAK